MYDDMVYQATVKVSVGEKWVPLTVDYYLPAIEDILSRALKEQIEFTLRSAVGYDYGTVAAGSIAGGPVSPALALTNVEILRELIKGETTVNIGADLPREIRETVVFLTMNIETLRQKLRTLKERGELNTITVVKQTISYIGTMLTSAVSPIERIRNIVKKTRKTAQDIRTLAFLLEQAPRVFLKAKDALIETPEGKHVIMGKKYKININKLKGIVDEITVNQKKIIDKFFAGTVEIPPLETTLKEVLSEFNYEKEADTAVKSLLPIKEMVEHLLD